jgi:hypothetical protein
MQLCAAVILMAFGQVQAPQTPADSLAAVHADLRRLPEELRPHIRYLSLYNQSLAERAKLYQVLCGHINSLSNQPDITKPAYLGLVIRVNLLDYGFKASVWDKISDPYFTTEIETPYGYYDRYGRLIRTETVKERTLAPWLIESPEHKGMLNDVVLWTQSKSPICRADYFLNQTVTAADGRLYYQFLNVKNEKEFSKLVGSDIRASEDFGAIWREAVAFSPVTLHARAFAFTRSLGGYDYRSYDFSDNKDGKNPLRILGKDIEKEAEAIERFSSLANGFWAVGIFNSKGDAVATAPDNIASDHTSRSNDRRVQAGISCFRCHMEGGLQDVDGWVQSLLKAPLNLQSPDYEKARQLRREYARSLQKVINDGRRIYEESVKEATGMTSKEYAATLALVFESYEDARVDLNRSATDIGVTPERWRSALERSAQAGNLNTVLAPMLVGREIPVRIWQDTVGEAHSILRGYQ